MYVATERLYITSDGRVLRESEMDERTVATLLLAKGGALADRTAREFGLLPAPAAEEATPAPVGEGGRRPASHPRPRRGREA